MPEERRQARLQAWVERELRALLQTDDVAILRAYVMGLVRGIGFSSAAAVSRATATTAVNGRIAVAADRRGGDTAAAASSGRGTEHRDAAAALRPFLQEHAEHFWHELRLVPCLYAKHP
jgi:hypothetical protein